VTILQEKILSYYRNYYQIQLNLPNWEELVRSRMKEEKFEEKKIDRLERFLGKFSGKRILDVGCGTGGFLAAAREKSTSVFGLDPDKEAIEICKLKGLKNVRVGRGENLDYKDNFFDIVYCYTVLEHVKDPMQTLKEMVRVVKKNGKIYIHTPNYLSFYEGHYKIFWLPKFPKFLARIYLKLRGRSTKFLNTINYLTPPKIIDSLKKFPLEIKLIKHPISKPQSLLGLCIYFYYKIFKIDPQIEMVIKKI